MFLKLFIFKIKHLALRYKVFEKPNLITCYGRKQHIMDFKSLLQQLSHTHDFMQNRAVTVVNQSHTLRNWLYGFYIVEYEQNGNDYAEYGSRLLYRIAAELKKGGIKGVSYTNLTLYRKFYLYYPQIGAVVSKIIGLETDEKSLMRNLQPLAEDFEKMAEILPPDLLL